MKGRKQLMEEETENDLFTDFTPEKVKVSSLVDVRRYKVHQWPIFQRTFENPEYYSNDFLKEYEKRFKAAIDYLSGRKITKIAKETKFPLYLIKRFVNDLIEGKTAEEIIKRQIGYEDKHGLEIAKAILKKFRETRGRIPLSNDKGIGGISSAANNGRWQELGINSWTDLLIDTFGEVNYGKYKGKRGLEQITIKMRTFNDEHGRMPLSTDDGFSEIASFAVRGTWKEFNINTWNDLLFKTFGEVNTEQGKYTGKRGLERAMSELRAFKEKYGRNPTTKDKEILGIAGTAMNGSWKELGINKWNDLHVKTFGIVNNEPGKYNGQQGLELAISDLRMFREKHCRKPIGDDKGISGIRVAANNGKWKELGVNSWSDLLMKAFGEVNIERGKYTGERGLKRAISDLLSFKEKHSRKPTGTDEGFRGLRSIACSGRWKKHGINSWTDLIVKTFGISNTNKYSGKEGLERAIKKLRSFKKEHDRLPTSKDKQVYGIVNAVTRGIWSEFDINKWNDLMMLTFRKVNKKRLIS
jgi:hypothetical protein